MTQTTPVPVMETINVGPVSYLDPKKNASAQLDTILQYGVPWGAALGLVSGIALLAGTAIVTGSVIPQFAGIAAIIGFAAGFGATVTNEVPFPNNSIRQFFGSPDGTVSPSGLQCYHPRLFGIGSLFLQAAIGEREMRPILVEDAETKEGTRFKVEFKVRRFYIRWPIPYVRAMDTTENVDIAFTTLEDALSALVRKYINLYTDEQVINVRDMKQRLADVLSGEVNVVNVPPEQSDDPSAPRMEEFDFRGPGKDEGKSLRSRLQKFGIYIPVGGVEVTNINEPDDIATVKAEQKEREVRGAMLKDSVEEEQALRSANPDVDVSKNREDLLATTGDADLIITRGSAGDFAQGAAINTSAKRRKRGEKESNSDKKS